MKQNGEISEQVTQTSRRHCLVPAAGLAGIGTVTVGLSITVLSFAQYGFVRDLG